MPELIPENRSRLNLAAKRALKKLGQPPDPTSLYCLQLAEWALDNKVNVRDSRLRSSLESLQGWSPEKVERFLELGPNGEKQDPVPWNKVREPEELAVQLLLALHDSLPRLMPGYLKSPA
jgi:hypothetical protein